MSSASSVAMKEWAIACEAMTQGVQCLMFRKGGIHEGPDGFVLEHSQFWLFPTGFHQSLEGVRPELRDALQLSPPDFLEAGVIPIQAFATVRQVFWVESEERIARLLPFQIQTEGAIAQRFHYRRPGLFVLTLEVQSAAEPWNVDADPRFDGCRSWVNLNQPLSTHELSAPAPTAEMLSAAEAILQEG